MIGWGSDSGPRDAPPVSAAFLGLLIFVGLAALAARAWDIEQAIAEQRERPRVERLRDVLAPMTER